VSKALDLSPLWDLLLLKRQSRKIPIRIEPCPRFSESALDLLNGGTGDSIMRHMMTSLTKYQHYSELLLADPSFLEIVRIGSCEPEVKRFSEMTRNEEMAFDARCHDILTSLLVCLQKSQTSKQKRTFYYYVLEYLVKEPSRSDFSYCLISRLARKLLEWLSESLTHSRQTGRKEIQKEPEEGTRKEVNRYFGWAIHSLLERYYQKQNEDDNEDVGNKKIVEFLKEMRIFHHDAINNKTYLEDCYDDFDILRNKGWLTLVSPAYFEFGNELLTKIRTKCNQKKLRELGNSCIQIAKEEVLGSMQLQTSFFSCPNESILSNKIKTKVYRQLVEKTLNARIGRESNKFRTENTGRKGKQQSDMTLRDSLRMKGKIIE
jgi:hypothetical protein